jgi:protein ImuB
VVAADPAGDAEALAALAAWCLRYSPLASPSPPDGIWIDVTGAAHLFGGERALLAGLLARLARAGARARAAIADTPGAAWALARHGREELAVVPPGGALEALAGLPLAALRLPAETVEAMARVGFERIGDLYDVARGPMAQRFGQEPWRRLDQALGVLFEPIAPIMPKDACRRRLAFAEPIALPESFQLTIGRLCEALCRDLEGRQEGARRLDLLFERIDGRIQAIRIGTVRPCRDSAHLARLLALRLETVDPGLGVEAMTLTAWRSEPLLPIQEALSAEKPAPDLAPLVDRLAGRLGHGRIFRFAPVESELPERAVRKVAPLAPGDERTWPTELPRPVQLLAPPEPVEAMALLPDHPPVLFVWRGARHRIRQADGPERVFGEWWRGPAEVPHARDYFRVEDEAGARFWLYRETLPAGGGFRWYLHGLFGA